MNAPMNRPVSTATEAQRLELFEQNLKLADQVAQLEEQLREKERQHVDEISSLKRSGLDPVATAVAMLQDYPALKSRVEELERQLAEAASTTGQAEQDKATLAEQVDQLSRVAEQLKQAREDDFKKLNALSREIDVQRTAVKSRDAELKELRSLNPKRMQKTLKTVQQRNKELQEMDKRNKQVISEMRHQLKEMEKIKNHNAELLSALDDACEMINNGESPALWENDSWQLIGHEDSTNCMLINHKPTGQIRLYRRGKGIERAPSVPREVQDQAAGRLERYARVDAQLKPYQGGK